MDLGVIDRRLKGQTYDEVMDKIVRAECKESLATFIEYCWPIIEPAMPFVGNWHIPFICKHLEAITDGAEFEDGSKYNRLLINIPPGCMKSLLLTCFWPLWEWGPKNMPSMRYICVSHSQDLAIRDGLRMRRVIESEWYQRLWPHVQLTSDQNQKTKFENTATGWRQAAAAGSITGARADRVLVDDPMSVSDAMSEQIKETTNTWFLEAVPTRLSSPKESAIIVIMQRLAEDDTSGVILDKQLGYDHIMLPMRFDPSRSVPTALGLEDERKYEGQLLFPDRFPEEVVQRDEKIMGKWAVAGQFQQSPSPRGGGIFPRDQWLNWPHDYYPNFDLVIASLDTAFTEKQENDPSAMTIWGIFTGGEQVAQVGHYANRVDEARAVMERQYTQEHPRTMLINAWSERLEFNDLIEKVRESCTRYQVDTLLIENKGPGISIGQELRRLYGNSDFGVMLVDPKSLDKVARAYAVQHLFFDDLIYAPNKSWAEMAISQCATFPKGKHDDIVDTVTMALNYMRKNGLLMRNQEWREELDAGRKHLGKPPAPLYRC